MDEDEDDLNIFDIYRRKIADAEADMGRKLETGEKVDLLLDNFFNIPDSMIARRIVKFIEEHPDA